MEGAGATNPAGAIHGKLGPGRRRKMKGKSKNLGGKERQIRRWRRAEMQRNGYGV